MTIKRDNDEERKARIEHLLERFVEGRTRSDALQEDGRRILSALEETRIRRHALVKSAESMLKRKSPKSALTRKKTR